MSLIKKKGKLNYIFNNPNPLEETAQYILKLLIEANREKLEQNINNEFEEINKG